MNKIRNINILTAIAITFLLLAVPGLAVNTIAVNSSGNNTAWDSTNGILTEPNGNANISISTGSGNTTIFVTLDTRLNATNSILYAAVYRDGAEIVRYAISSNVYEQTTSFIVNQTETLGTHYYALKVYATSGKRATIYKWSMTATYLQPGNYTPCTDCPNATVAANAASWSAKPNSFSQLNDVSGLTPITDQIWKYNGIAWTNGAPTAISAGPGANLFYDNTASDISGYESLTTIPDTNPEQDESIVVNNSTVQFEQYITPLGGLGGAQIDPGVWIVDVYTNVSSTDGNSQLLFNISKVTADGGNNTFLFSVATGNITNTVAPSLYTINTVQPAFSINSTDRLTVNVSATTTATVPITVHFYHSGTAHYSFISTPLITRHNDLSGKQGGDGTNFVHLGLSSYTNLTTYDLAGVFPFSNPGFVTNATVKINLTNGTGSLPSVNGSALTYTNGTNVSGTNIINSSTVTVVKNTNGTVQLTSSGASTGSITVNTNYTATSTDYVILINAPAADRNVTLPAPIASKEYNIKRIDANVAIVYVNSSYLIDGSYQVLLNQWDSVRVYANATQYFII